jgi:hypothetical protein
LQNTPADNRNKTGGHRLSVFLFGGRVNAAFFAKNRDKVLEKEREVWYTVSCKFIAFYVEEREAVWNDQQW